MTTTLKPIMRTVEKELPRTSFGREGLQTVTPQQLLLQKSQYFNVPERQRGSVWPLWMQKLWIDTLLREPGLFPFSPIYFDKEWVDTGNGRRLLYFIQDGRQRIETIYKFLDDELRTLKEPDYRKRVTESELADLPFDILCSQLPQELHEMFNNYPIPVIVSDEVEPWLAEARYRRMNGTGVKLSKGELLRSYQRSVAKQLADLMTTHSLFAHNMKAAKRKDRQYRSELALYLIFMSIHGFPNQMSRSAIDLLAAGKSDYALSEQKQQEIFTDLDKLECVYRGAQITAKTDGIPVWQSGYYLKRAGCDFQESKRGCLVPFFTDTKKERLEGINTGNLSSYASMTSARSQVQFWTKYKGRLLDADGLVFPDRDRWQRELHGDPPVQVHEPPFDLETGLVLTPLDRVLS
jgi:hypothetical protein